jgi:hypothetical protein
MGIPASALLCMLRRGPVAVLMVTFLGCVPPRLANEPGAQRSGALPARPEGVVQVYSERYVLSDRGIPVFRRRSVDLFTATGRFLQRYENPVGDGLIRIEVPVGSYIIVSEVRWAARTVRVEVQEGRPVLISEAHLAQAPLWSTLRTASQTSANPNANESGVEQHPARPCGRLPCQ